MKLDMDQTWIQRGAQWLRSVQHEDGGWGESCASYSEGRFVPAPSTPSQTAWAILGLLASGDTTSESLSNGIEYLVETQRADGGWDDRHLKEALRAGRLFGVFEVLGMEADKPDRPDAMAVPARVDEIRIENVSFEYREGQPVVRNFDVTVRGDSMTVRESGGCGRTATLVRGR